MYLSLSLQSDLINHSICFGYTLRYASDDNNDDINTNHIKIDDKTRASAIGLQRQLQTIPMPSYVGLSKGKLSTSCWNSWNSSAGIG